jgi:hypothetical protein
MKSKNEVTNLKRLLCPAMKLKKITFLDAKNAEWRFKL